MTYQGNRVWQPDEVATGVWMALGQETPEGIKEVTPRRYVAFDFERRGDTTGALGVNRTFNGRFTFDVILYAKAPAGAPIDICRNARAYEVKDAITIMTTWSGLRAKENEARAYLDRPKRRGPDGWSR